MFIRVANIESQNLSISSMSACNALYTTFQSKSVIIKFRFVRRNYGTSSRQAGTICSSLVTEEYSCNLRFRRKCGIHSKYGISVIKILANKFVNWL